MKAKVRNLKSRTAAAIVCFVFLLQEVHGHGGNKTGVCMKAEKTRTGRACQGRLYTVNSEISRAIELPENSQVCRYHWDIARRQNLRCSCPKPENYQHSRLSVNNIPQRFYAVFDEVGANMAGYRPGTRWCNLCKKNADEEFKVHRLYVSAARAKEVSRISQTHSRSFTALQLEQKYKYYIFGFTID